MKNKKILAILTIAASVSMFAAGCNFGGAEPEEQVVVTETPTPAATATPTPEPTIAPDVQDSTYTGAGQDPDPSRTGRRCHVFRNASGY